jgi:PAS domain S-box-containing protein
MISEEGPDGRTSVTSMRNSNDRLAAILEAITDAFFTLNLEWRFTYINSEAERLLQRTHDELLSKSLWQEFPCVLGTTIESEYRLAMETGQTRTFETFYERFQLWLNVRVYPSDDGLAVYLRDNTASRKAQEHLQLLEVCISRLNDIVVIIDAAQSEPEPLILFVNDAFVARTGYTPEEVIGRPIDFLYCSENRNRENERIRLALAARQPVHAETISRTKNGQTIWMETDIVPIRDANQTCTHFVAVVRDISERKRAQRELQLLNAELEQRVAARTAELDQANRAKSWFLAAMSHEIRTPMNGVIGMTDVLQQTSLKGYQVEMVDLIRDSAFALLTIIEDILDFSKIEAGHLELESHPVDLAEVVENVGGMAMHLAERDGVELYVFTDPALPKLVTGDALRLRQVMINLVSNAIKFSSGLAREGVVRLRAELAIENNDVAHIQLSVIDNGIGMDEQTQRRVFAPFVQADPSITRRFGGTGLGLAISNMLVELMGGKIALRSAPDQGSEFSVLLAMPILEQRRPSDASLSGVCCLVVGLSNDLSEVMRCFLEYDGADVHCAPDQVAAAEWLAMRGNGETIVLLQACDEKEITLSKTALPGPALRRVVIAYGRRRNPRQMAPGLVMIDKPAVCRQVVGKAVALAAGLIEPDSQPEIRDHKAMPSAQFLFGAPGVPILVAEDNVTNQKVILHQLRQLGLQAEVVGNGKIALERWRRCTYALLLIDVHMPELDGYALARAIRAEELEDRHIPIIALTANALEDEMQRCLDAGMDDYLPKPARLIKLQALLARWLPTHGLQQDSDKKSFLSEAKTTIDLQVLEDMIGDDPDDIEAVLRDFQISTRSIASEMRAAHAVHDAGALAFAAHKLKSSAGSIGALQLAECCARIEQEGKGTWSRQLNSLFTQFEMQFSGTDTWLTSWLQAVVERDAATCKAQNHD